jgi:AAA ATPase domain
MAIPHFSQTDFVGIVNHFLLPSSPVRTIELLHGRAEQLKQIQRAMESPGRHAFVYGDRGVGKTSLAQTAAYIAQSADAKPIFVGCDIGTTLFYLVEQIAARLLTQAPIFQAAETAHKRRGSLGQTLSVDLERSIREGRVPTPRSVNEAVELIQYAAPRYSANTVIVVDEFERITDKQQRALFGDFIKQLADQEVEAKFIFSGVGDSLEDLLAGHESSFRYLAAVALDRLGWDPLQEIITSVGQALGIYVDKEYLYRTAAISDGFPHYVHLIGSKLFWDLYEDPEECDCVLSHHFLNAVKQAVKDVEPHLKQKYEKATQKYKDEYQEVLWAVADHPDLRRRSSDIYESYCRIMGSLRKPPFDRPVFDQRMNRLKQPAHGAILKGTRAGWYEFREPIIRGYVRLIAEERGVVLDIFHGLQPSTPLR